MVTSVDEEFTGSSLQPHLLPRENQMASEAKPSTTNKPHVSLACQWLPVFRHAVAAMGQGATRHGPGGERREK